MSRGVGWLLAVGLLLSAALWLVRTPHPDDTPIAAAAGPSEEARTPVAANEPPTPSGPGTARGAPLREFYESPSGRPLSDDELQEYGINPDMADWAFRFLADRRDPEFVEQFFVLHDDESLAVEECFEVALPDGRLDQYCDNANTHPFFTYDDEPLEQLALVDPLAAQVLGHRRLTEDPATAEQYFIRASALSGKPGPLLTYISMNQGLLGHPDSDALLSEETGLRNYTLAVVAQRIGYPLLIARDYRRVLEEHGVRQEAIEAAEAASADVFRQMDEVRNTSIGGNL